MGIKKLFFLMAVICLFNPSFGQTDELNTNLQKLQGLLTRVLSGTKAYDQQIKPLQFGAVQYIVEETDQKGKGGNHGIPSKYSTTRQDARPD